MGIKTIPIPELTERDKARFWAKVDVRGKDECWEWIAAGADFGYGIFRIGSKKYYSHRVSWVLERGLIPEDILVLHECDNPPCCNPIHFFLGTQKINIHDAMKKRRLACGDRNGARIHPGARRGDRNGNSKLTKFKVLEMRKLYSEGETQVSIAKYFEIGQSHVSRIVNKKNWDHV